MLLSILSSALKLVFNRVMNHVIIKFAFSTVGCNNSASFELMRGSRFTNSHTLHVNIYPVEEALLVII